MDEVMHILADQLITTLAPILGSFAVVLLVAAFVLSWVRNRAIKQIGGFIAVLVWVGWMASYYKVV